jgi:tRNA (guanine-N7-)-methyltransferase
MAFRLARLRNLKTPNPYAQVILQDLKNWVFDEETAPPQKGQWSSFGFSEILLELGTGNGLHFANLAQKNPRSLVLGVELKLKPVVQSIRRALRANSVNARMLRYDVHQLQDVFQENEVWDIYLHFPDPWLSPRKPENRMTSLDNLQRLAQIQKAGSFLEFKTDSRALFDWSLKQIELSTYQIELLSFDWHQHPASQGALRTQFESLFIRQGLPIHYVLLRNCKNA